MIDLRETLEKDELHLLSIITNRPKLTVKLDGDLGEQFPTYVGTCVSVYQFVESSITRNWSSYSFYLFSFSQRYGRDNMEQKSLVVCVP